MTLRVRRNIDEMPGYVPGEQPQESGWIKLNTNENPYPPSPHVVDAICRAARGPLNVYPDALATPFREAAADVLQVDPDWILPANGSDENLTIIIRTMCDPGDVTAFPWPTYVLYESLAQIQDCRTERLYLEADGTWDEAQAQRLREQARVFFVPRPNSPTGTVWSPEALSRLVPERGLLVLDEAYADFMTGPTGIGLLKTSEFSERLVITRTLSKSYSLAGLRFGFSIAAPAITRQMRKVKDSYNCDAIAIAAATAAIQDQDWMRASREKILATRRRLVEALPAAGFRVTPGEANFVWTQHESGAHREICERLRQHRILLRYMRFSGVGPQGGVLDGIRITVGTDEQVDALLDVIGACV